VTLFRKGGKQGGGSQSSPKGPAPKLVRFSIDPGAVTVDRGGVLCAIKTLPSTDYKSSGWPEIVVEIRGPTTSRLLQPGGQSPGGTRRGFGAFPRCPVHPGGVTRPWL